MMGLENEIVLMNGILLLDGEPIGTGTIQLPEITLDADAPELDGVFGSFVGTPMEMTFAFKTPKHWRCRGRKRFIKLVMSEGISRNGAVWLADFMRRMMPYREAWERYFLSRMLCGESCWGFDL